VLDPADKLGSVARTATGNLVPKPMIFHPADDRAIAPLAFRRRLQCQRRRRLRRALRRQG